MRVLLRPAAREDLAGIYRFVAADSPTNAFAYVSRIRRHYQKLAEFPERGAPREELGQGIRLLSFERRVSILYRVEGSDVRVLRILYAGQQLPEELS
ncbi:type II toxin-antitoxin system RelE/ParE family toxin [Escherichia coli]|nr:type II toxin-antitoxin system RelE/ParE family toxin [Escherichia coli]